MIEPPRIAAGDTGDGDATRSRGEPDPAPAGEEPSLLSRAALKSDVQQIPVDKVSVVEPVGPCRRTR